MELAEQGEAEPRAGRDLGGVLCGGAEAASAQPAAGGAPVLAGRARLLAVHRAVDGGTAAAAAADADKANPRGKAGAVLEDNCELIRLSIQESIQARVQARVQEGIQEGIQERIRENIDYDLRVRLPQTLARANALQMAFDSC